MKVILILFLTFLLICTNSLFSQWQAIYYPNQNYELPFLEAMDFKDSQNGFAAGDSYILRTSDGGTNWDTVYISPIRWMFSDITYINPSTILAVGTSGLILKSNDNGNSWNSTTLPSSGHSTFFASSSTGYICGSYGSIYKTMNGGNTWITLNSNINSHLSSIFFINDSIGFASGSDKLIKTTDGGNSWNKYTFNDSIMKYSIKIHFPSDSIGYALVNNNFIDRIYKTNDQGNSWNLLDSAINAYYATSLYFTDDSTGYVTSKFNIAKTTNGGKTWLNQQSAPNYAINFHDDLMDIQMLNADTGFAVGWGQFYRTFNGGELTSFQNNYSETKDKLILYPNPATNSVKISFSSNKSNNFQIKIFNLKGSLVKVKEVTSSENLKIDVASFPRGVYLVQAIMKDGNIYNEKLILSN